MEKVDAAVTYNLGLAVRYDRFIYLMSGSGSEKELWAKVGDGIRGKATYRGGA
jgi:hypothetical protein